MSVFFVSFLFYFFSVLISTLFIRKNIVFFSFIYTFGFLLVSAFTYYIIQIFIVETGSFLDFDSTDSVLYDMVAKKSSIYLDFFFEWYEKSKYGYDDTGAIILPYLSYLFFDSFYFSRFCNIFFHFLTGYMFLKSRNTIKGRFVIILYLYNPIIIYYISSGLKEVLMSFFVVLFFYSFKSSFIKKYISLFFVILFRKLLFFQFILYKLLESKLNKIFILIFILILSIIYLVISSNNINFLLYAFNNPDFILDRVPLTAFVAFLTGPIPLFSSNMEIYSDIWWSGMITFNLLVINYWHSMFKRKIDNLDYIIILSVFILILSGTLWKVRYWIPIFCMIIYQFQKLNLNFSKIPVIFYLFLLLIANTI